MVSQEQIIYRSKPHWIRLARPAVFVAVGLFCSCCTWLLAVTDPPPGQPPPPSEMINFFVVCSACILGVGMVSTFVITLNHINTDFILTNRRIIKQVTGLGSRSLEIFLQSVDSVYVETPFLGKMLGYGRVLVMSGRSNQFLENFSNPEEVRNKIQEQVSRLGT
jgi:hypothetical protein